MWVNQIFGGIHWHRPVLRHPLCQLRDIKYYSSSDVNKFPREILPVNYFRQTNLLFSSKLSKTTASTNSQISAKIMQFISSRFFRKYLAHYSSHFSIHPPSIHFFFLLISLSICLKMCSFIVSILSRFDNYSQIPSISRNNPARNPPFFHENFPKIILFPGVDH